jgi:hypothetical protein
MVDPTQGAPFRPREIADKIRARGAGWFWRRLLRELRVPETVPGRRLLPVTRGILRFAQAPWRVLARALIGWAPYAADSLYLFYDLEVSPITFDFCWALVAADSRRRDLGLAELRVVFVPGRLNGLREEPPDYDVVVDAAARRWRLQHVLVPICGLLPSCASVLICGSRAEAAAIQRTMARHVHPERYDPAFPLAHRTSEVLERARTGKPVAALGSPPRAVHYAREWLEAKAGGRQVIAITLRDYGFGSDRNSNLAAWTAFARGLDSRRFLAVFIPDTERASTRAMSALAEFAVFEPACWNVHLRAAFYELAYLNMGVSAGPMALAWMMPKCRYLMFKVITPTVAQTDEAAIRSHGFQPGTSLPFASPLQKWVWEDDDLPVLEREFRLMVAEIDRSMGAQ